MKYKKPIFYILLITMIVANMTIFDRFFSTHILLFVYGEDNIPSSQRQCAAKYPGLFSGALRLAVLESLPDGELLVSSKLSITKSQLDAEIAKSPAKLREQFKNNPFFALERMAINGLLAEEARTWATSKKLNIKDMKDDKMISNYLKELIATISVSTEEARQFYESNTEMFGGAKFKEIQAELKSYLLNNKKQSFIETHINNLGKRRTIKINEAWAKSQYPKAINNPADKARRSGRPSLIDFGASGCRPCDMMAPILEELKEEYAKVINVAFVDVRDYQILGARYGVSSIPVQVFFDKDGKEVYRHVGFLPKNKILEKLDEMGVAK